MTGGWSEVGADVFVRRYDPWDVNVCVVRGSGGLLLVDTRASARQGEELRADLEELGRPVRWVVNTHAHFDHTFGNQCFVGEHGDGPVPIYAHTRVPAHLDRYEVPMLEGWLDVDETATDELREVVVIPPTHLVGEHAVLDLGDRSVELVHLGRGHTDNDLLVYVRDAKVWLAGDLLEESGPPQFGSGSYPLEWADTLTALAERLGPDTVVVPGHGAPVGVGFVAEQRTALGTVARVIRELFDAGVPLELAAAMGVDAWPYPVEAVASAVADGYSHLALDPGH